MNSRHRIRSRKFLGTGLRVTGILGTLLSSLGLSGCHSAFIEATLINRTDKPLRLVEVDYPSASFGTQNLIPGASFHYKFKLIGEGPVKLLWTDEAQKEHTVEGPYLHEGQQGLLTITVTPAQTAWQTTFR